MVEFIKRKWGCPVIKFVYYYCIYICIIYWGGGFTPIESGKVPTNTRVKGIHSGIYPYPILL